MNRTLLLIICDFLLLNLLALTRWDAPDAEAPREAPLPAMVTNAVSGVTEDLVISMRAALEDERGAREQLARQMQMEQAARNELESGLSQTRQVAQQLAERLTNTVQQATVTRQELSQTAARVEASEKERLAMAESIRKADEERRKLMDALNAEREQARRQQQAFAALDAEKREVERRAQALDSAVKVAEAEKSLLRENVTELRQQVGRVQEEKEIIQAQTTALASGVNQLAVRSEELKQEIRDNTPVSGNLLFQDFLSNRVQVAVGGVASTLFSSGPRQKETATVLVTDGVQVAALVHISETPYVLSSPGFGLDQPSARVSTRSVVLSTAAPNFLRADPRGMLVPVESAAAQAAGLRVYPISKTPFRFPDALLVSRGGRYFGEVEFKVDARTPGYVKMKSKVLSRLFGEFSPSTGDLVLSRNGELLGFMVNSDYCVVLSDLQLAPGPALTPDMNKAAVGRRLEEMKTVLDRLMYPLQ